MPSPYLHVPLMGSEEEDSQQAAVFWISKLADECMAVAERMAEGFNKYQDEWQPDMLPDVEHLHYELHQLQAAMHKAGILKHV